MNGRPLFSRNFLTACIKPTDTLAEAAASINRSGLLVSCVVDDERRLLGILTDSDLRRALLRHTPLTTPVIEVCNRTPFTCSPELGEEALSGIALESGKREIPLVDGENVLQDIFLLGIAQHRTFATKDEFRYPSPSAPLNADLFVFAGGLGTRLRPLVADRPKPLAMVGERPIIEHLLLHAYRSGIRRVFVSLNYKAAMIEEHLRQPRFEPLHIEFIHEESKLGTAGSLALARERISRTIIACNADLLTNFSFARLVEAHGKATADVTSVVRQHRMNVPYGVVDVESDEIVGLREKPELTFLINAGIYALSPQVLESIQDHEPIDMPDLIRRRIALGKRVRPFLMHEYWLDVGKPEDFMRANADIKELFKSDGGELAYPSENPF